MVWDGFMAIGDAACTSNPIHGGGMGPAMLSAKSAAQTIEEALSKGDSSKEALWSYHNRYMELYGAKQAGLDVLRMYLQLMSDDELNFVFEKKVITSADVGEIGYKGDVGSALISKVSSAIKLLSRPSLLARLKKVKDYMDKAKELYYAYPKSPDGFKVWKVQVDRLFDEYRVWLYGS
jgi:flavin-dependent dehydrogenase